jgi:hypothetical protein
MGIEIKFEVTGVDDLRAAFEKTKLKVAEANMKIVNDAALVVVRNTKKRFRPRLGGDMVISKQTGNPWYRETGAYAPVPPDPTSRSGSLVAHIGFETDVVGLSGAMAMVGPTIIHGKYVAQGSDPPGTGSPQPGAGRGHNRRPFPYLEEGMKDSMAEIGEIVKTTYGEALG